MSADKQKKIVLLHGVCDEGNYAKLAQSAKQKDREVFILEGRPSLRTVEINARGLCKYRIRPTLIADNMAGFLFAQKRVGEVWMSYFSVDEEGAMCPIGALILGVLAKRHKVPLRIFPASSKPRFLGNPKEIFYFNGRKVAPPKISGYVPLVEWVPRQYYSRVHGRSN